MPNVKRNRLKRRKESTEAENEDFFDVFKELADEKTTKKRGNKRGKQEVQDAQEVSLLSHTVMDIIANDDTSALAAYIKATDEDFRLVYDILAYAAAVGSFDCFIDMLFHNWDTQLESSSSSSSSINAFKCKVLQNLCTCAKRATATNAVKSTSTIKDAGNSFFKDQEITEYLSLHPFIIALYAGRFRIVELLCCICPFHIVSLFNPVHSNQAVFSLIRNAGKEAIQHFLLMLDYSLTESIEAFKHKSSKFIKKSIDNDIGCEDHVKGQMILKEFLDDLHDYLEGEGVNHYCMRY